jgi:hypothetical protein
MGRQSNVNREGAPLATEGINRRTLGMAGVATLVSTLAASARAQEMPPTPDNLERELPSPRQAPAACAELPELPTPQPSGVSERLFPGFHVEDVQTSGAKIPRREQRLRAASPAYTWPSIYARDLAQGRSVVDGQLHNHCT